MPNVNGNSGRTSFGGSAQAGGNSSGGRSGGLGGGGVLGGIGGIIGGKAIKSGKPVNDKDVRDAFSKASQAGGKPGEDLISQTQAAIPNKPLTDVEKALIEARRQRALLGPGYDIATAIAPAPVSWGMPIGNAMGQAAEDAAAANPDNFTGNPATGEVKSKSGPLTSNRAQPAPSAKTTEASQDDSIKKNKNRPLPTVLGAIAAPLGTEKNPQLIK